MTALPVPHPARAWPITAAEYAALPEDPDRRFELQEGALVLSPRPVPAHQNVIGELFVQLRSQVPRDLKLLVEVDLDLHLVPATHPGTVRVPDLVVVTRAAYERVGREGGLLRADEAVLAVEVLSAGTRRTDTVVKAGEYADAGIGHYWTLDLLDGPGLTARHLGGAFGYIDAAPVRGGFRTDAPFPAEIDLDALA